MTNPANKKIQELLALFPDIIHRLCNWQNDGDFVLLSFMERLPADVEKGIDALLAPNGGCILQDPVSGSLVYRFPLDQPTRNLLGEEINQLPAPPAKPEPTEQKPASRNMTPLAYYDWKHCQNCINPNGGAKPCSDVERCMRMLELQVNEQRLELETKLLNVFERVWSNLVEHAYSNSEREKYNKPPQPMPNLNTPITPASTPATPPANGTLSPEEKERLTKPPVRNPKDFFVQNDITWCKTTTQSGKYCEKAFREYNLKNGVVSGAYKELEALAAQKKGGGGYFYFTSQADNAHPYIARMESKK